MVNDMPGYDGTGPLGRGPMTGGRRGRCLAVPATPVETGDANVQEEKDVVYGLGRGGVPCGCGRGYGGGYGGGMRGRRAGRW